MKKNLTYLLYFFLAILAVCCEKDLPNQPRANQSPSTRLWITSETMLNESVSRQHLYFYGEDPDGYVTGYLIAYVKDSTGTFTQIPNPDTLSYIWTTRNDTVVALPLLQKKDKFAIIVRAVDNRFSSSEISSGAHIKGFPAPYWDRDSNGMKNGNDIALPAMQDGVDPKGAIQLFPLKNTPPNVRFAVTADDNATTIEQPDTTYTVATFSWVGTDDDGNNTITGYRIALNDNTDSAQWTDLPPTATTVTLIVKRAESDIAGATVEAQVYTGLFVAGYDHMLATGKKISNLRLNAENVLYLQAKDIANEYSTRARMPSTAQKKWFVKKPKSGQKMLVVADYGAVPNGWKANILSYYHKLFADQRILNGALADFDYLDRANFPTFLNPALIKTLMLYDVVLWFTDKTPTLTAAQIGLGSYTNSGGKIIFVTQFQDQSNTTYLYSDLVKYRDFLPLDKDKVITDDSIYISNRFYWKDPGTGTNVKLIPMQPGYPVLYADSMSTSGFAIGPTATHPGVAFRKIFKDNDSRYLYKIDSSHTYILSPQGQKISAPDYVGELELACIDNAQRIVAFALPLHLLNGWGQNWDNKWDHNLPLFFKQVIEQEFKIGQ